MTKEFKIRVIEEYVERLIYEYRVLKRTSEILVLEDRDREDMDLGLEELRLFIKAVRKCRTLKELDKYINVKKLLKDVRKGIYSPSDGAKVPSRDRRPPLIVR